MRKIRLLAIPVTFGALVLTSAVTHADKSKHEERYCSALMALGNDLSKLEAIGPSSTIHELRKAVDNIDGDGRNVAKEARKIGTPTSKRFVESVDRLSSEARSLSDNMTVEQARSKVDGNIQDVKRNAQELATESGCPEAVPELPRSAPDKGPGNAQP
jgi:hypothetical protein